MQRNLLEQRFVELIDHRDCLSVPAFSLSPSVKHEEEGIESARARFRRKRVDDLEVAIAVGAPGLQLILLRLSLGEDDGVRLVGEIVEICSIGHLPLAGASRPAMGSNCMDWSRTLPGVGSASCSRCAAAHAGSGLSLPLSSVLQCEGQTDRLQKSGDQSRPVTGSLGTLRDLGLGSIGVGGFLDAPPGHPLLQQKHTAPGARAPVGQPTRIVGRSADQSLTHIGSTNCQNRGSINCLSDIRSGLSDNQK